MKAVIIGGGSIGKRHSKNLEDLQISTRIVDVDEIENIDSILSEGFNFGLVCTPNIFHIQHCTKLAEFSIPIFCEKPFYTDPQGLTELISLVEDKQLTTMVGCNLRFVGEVKDINSNTKYINTFFGYDLKKWRPDSKHLDSYSANKHLGGGILLDAIHELDYLYYKFGSIKSISYFKDKFTSITNDTEDVVNGRVVFENETIADFHMNYLSEQYLRYYDILDDGVLKRRHLTISNQMYIDEIKYFVDRVTNNSKCMNSFQEASTLLSFLL